nr:tRNA N6-adenosine threonylcarbamoyltransferase-like [Nerophis lumbriciformis]
MTRLAHPLVLGIESSCDDTACAVLDGDGRVLASAVSSQLAAHRPFGGVVPEIASRQHLEAWPATSAEALAKAGVELAQIDLVAATRGPGLIGCLLVGLALGRSIAWGLDKPFYGTHHLEGHIYSPFLATGGNSAAAPPERFIALVVSGGHSSILEIAGDRIESLAETRDDAMGEVFDKVGKRLGLAYPQGPKVDQLAELGQVERGRFKVKRAKGELFFTFSGLKSQALREIERLEQAGQLEKLPRGAERPAEDLPPKALDLLANFRDAAVRQLIDRLERLHGDRPLDCLAVSGGAAANRLLRRELRRWADERSVDLRLVTIGYSGDNAAMIAFAALIRHRQGFGPDPASHQVASRLPFATGG